MRFVQREHHDGVGLQASVRIAQHPAAVSRSQRVGKVAVRPWKGIDVPFDLDHIVEIARGHRREAFRLGTQLGTHVATEEAAEDANARARRSSVVSAT